MLHENSFSLLRDVFQPCAECQHQTESGERKTINLYLHTLKEMSSNSFEVHLKKLQGLREHHFHGKEIQLEDWSISFE